MHPKLTYIFGTKPSLLSCLSTNGLCEPLEGLVERPDRKITDIAKSLDVQSEQDGER